MSRDCKLDKHVKKSRSRRHILRVTPTGKELADISQRRPKKIRFRRRKLVGSAQRPLLLLIVFATPSKFFLLLLERPPRLLGPQWNGSDDHAFASFLGPAFPFFLFTTRCILTQRGNKTNSSGNESWKSVTKRRDDAERTLPLPISSRRRPWIAWIRPLDLVMNAAVYTWLPYRLVGSFPCFTGLFFFLLRLLLRSR